MYNAPFNFQGEGIGGINSFMTYWPDKWSVHTTCGGWLGNTYHQVYCILEISKGKDAQKRQFYDLIIQSLRAFC